MSALRMIVPNADYTALGQGKRNCFLPYDPYAAYVLGSTTAMSLGGVIKDWSGNGHDLTAAGTTGPSPGVAYTNLSKDKYYDCPFSGSDVEGVAGGISIMFVAKAASGQSVAAVSNFNASGEVNVQMTLPSASLLDASINTPARSTNFANDAARGTRWNMFGTSISAGTASPVVAGSIVAYEGNGDSDALRASVPTTFAAQDIGGPLNFRIGNNRTGQYAGNGDFAVVAFWRGALTPEQWAAVYAQLAPFMAENGLDI